MTKRLVGRPVGWPLESRREHGRPVPSALLQVKHSGYSAGMQGFACAANYESHPGQRAAWRESRATERGAAPQTWGCEAVRLPTMRLDTCMAPAADWPKATSWEGSATRCKRDRREQIAGQADHTCAGASAPLSWAGRRGEAVVWKMPLCLNLFIVSERPDDGRVVGVERLSVRDQRGRGTLLSHV